MCTAQDLNEQRRIWNQKIRPVLLSGFLRKVIFANPAFMWNALGVPMNQANVFLKETTVSQFAIDTFDPVALNTPIKTDNYHCELGRDGPVLPDYSRRRARRRPTLPRRQVHEGVLPRLPYPRRLRGAQEGRGSKHSTSI